MAEVHKCDTSRGTKRKHCTSSTTDKTELLKKLESGVPVKRTQEAKLLQSFANSGSKKQMGIRKTMKDGKSSELDKVLITWLKQRLSEGVELSRDLVREQARLYHEELGLNYQCDCSSGWLRRFKQRHGLKLRAVRGEKHSPDKEAAAAFVDERTKSPTARDLASRMDEGDLEEWMDVDNALATGRHYSDSEIVQMAVYQDKEDSGEERCCNENEENRRENTY
ncbi:hypothetical protein M514_20841 [Trichuris suis]|uniref:HTH CENPB-type domain-containing protein n=1 Tax=Trichuris suis TaxID=68888 RepID=A0A085NBX9_9BILA|nr:hypothetical protein M514_20841 [Trichuris suis]